MSSPALLSPTSDEKQNSRPPPDEDRDPSDMDTSGEDERAKEEQIKVADTTVKLKTIASSPSSSTTSPNHNSQQQDASISHSTNSLEKQKEKPTVTPEANKTLEDSSTTPPKHLERAQEIFVSDLDEQTSAEKTPPAQQQINQNHSISSPDNDDDDDGDDSSSKQAQDDDSSNDESSYFADPNNLPSPKTGARRYSWASAASAPAPRTNTGIMHGGLVRQTSDASLSLSDDSDDGSNLHHSDSAIFYKHHTPRTGGLVDLQATYQITRMHSVSSLVSTSSHNSESSDPSVKDELRDVAREHSFHSSRGDTPSGRQSPLLGHHSNSRNAVFLSPSPPHNSANPTPPPPTIMPSYAGQIGEYPHPQVMAAQEWVASMAGEAQKQQEEIPRDSIQSLVTAGSLAYSEEDGDEGLQQQSERGSRKSNNRDESNISLTDYGAVERKMRYKGSPSKEKGLRVYWQRWIMLMYMSVLNLLSDWTCYSVAPIALLTEEAFGNINPEQLVVVFLGANGIATACEPIILSRLGLRRTVLFGALLLMMGSIVKSGGMPPIIQANLEKGHGEWRVYLGFFLVGLSQPLYQCTPALLSASWFPERERTMATGVALNANQLGIGFAFIFGTLLVADSDDIPDYFGLLSIISTITFLGALIQFDDAPPTPPSDTARVMRGTLEVNLPQSVRTLFDSVRNLGSSGNGSSGLDPVKPTASDTAPAKSKSSKRSGAESGSRRSGRSSGRKSSRSSAAGAIRPSGSTGSDSGARRRNTSRTQARSKEDTGFHGLTPPPSPARYGSVSRMVKNRGMDPLANPYPAPSPMMPGNVAPQAGSEETESDEDEQGAPYPYGQMPPYPGMPYPPAGYSLPPMMGYPAGEGGSYPAEAGQQQQQQQQEQQSYGYPYQGYPPQYQYPYWDPRFQQSAYAYYQQQQEQYYPPPPNPYYYSYQHAPPLHRGLGYQSADAVLPQPEKIDEGAEPVLTITPHHLDIDIRDDQVFKSTRACLARPGFIHALVSFTVSGIVINTLSTFMDYLVRLNGAGREMTGIVGGSFQFVIMISSLIVGKLCDRTRAYYSVTIGMLVLGAFGLAECGVSLNADRGSDLRWSLVIVAALVGPLQPVSTELGVDVVYPLSENTVLVIQQLFSNLLSAAFIPCFKAMKDIGKEEPSDSDTGERPEYTFSFYLLIVLHAVATVFFATFNGRYLRYEHELEKKAQEEAKERAAFEPVHYPPPPHMQPPATYDDERAPLTSQHSLV